MTGDLEARLRRLEDRAALDDLNVRYFLAADGDDMRGLGACFDEHATFATSGRQDAAGRPAIETFITDARRQMGLTVHTPTHALFSFAAADEATGIVGAFLQLVLGGQCLLGAVRYQDRYVRSDDAWLIAARDMRVIYIAPWADVGTAIASPLPVRWPGIDALPSDFPRPSG